MKKNRIYTLLVFFASLLVAVVLVEIIMRLFYNPVPAIDANKIEGSFKDYDYEPPLNTLGFREAPLTPEVHEEDTRRILFIGDSFTFGNGVEDGSNRFSDIIESRLNKHAEDSNTKYHIYNAGISGTEPDAWVGFLNSLLPVYNPGAVVVVFFLRDGTDLCTSLMCYKQQLTRLQTKVEKYWVYQNTYIGKYIGNKMVERVFHRSYLEKMKQSYLGNENERQSWTKQRNHLLEIRDICMEIGIDCHLVIFPMLFGLESEDDYQFFDVENEISRFAEKHNIPVFSLTPGFLGHDSQSLWVSPSDQHPNEKGHEVAADILFPYIKEELAW